MRHVRYASDWGLVNSLQDEINRLFSSPACNAESADYVPQIDFAEEDDRFIVTADLPGVKKEDVEVSVTGTVLTIKGVNKQAEEQKSKNFYYAERKSGSFQRIIELPSEIDLAKTAAAYKDGVLELTLPKAESAKPQQIKVEVK